MAFSKKFSLQEVMSKVLDTCSNEESNSDQEQVEDSDREFLQNEDNTS